VKIENNSVVSIHYTLTDDEGNIIDSSVGKTPLNFLQGAGGIIPGLERELLGCEVGENKKVRVEPADGYGELEADLVQTLPHEAFSGVTDIEVGMEFQAQGPGGQVQKVVVTAVSDEGVTIDGNHELAGKFLNFDVTIAAVREATETEIAHGHVH
jgi:FKBP-type peptidyl-prolyl cis-trans isomerase SlyD